MPRTAARLSTLTLALVLAASACSREIGPSAAADPTGDPRSAGEVMAAAVDSTLHAARFGIRYDASLELETGVIAMRAEGRVDRETHVSDMRFELDAGTDAKRVHVSSDGSTAWASAEGSLRPDFPDGATYVAGDAGRLAGAHLFDTDDLLDVVPVLCAGGQARPEVRDTHGEAGVRSYSFTTTYAAALDAAGGDAEALSTALDLAEGSGDAELAVKVSIGADDVVRRLSIDVAAPGEVPSAAHYELSLGDIGEEVPAPTMPAPEYVATGQAAEQAFLEALD